MARETVILLADADVLIDYTKTDLSILTLVAQHTGKVYVLDEVLRTVDGLNKTKCKRHGITVIEADTELLLAAGKHSGALSFEDWLCYLACETEGWVYVTNDRALIRTCRQGKVQHRRGLRLMVELVRDGHLTRTRALKVARAIQTTNPHHINETILYQFEKVLDRL